MPLRIRFLYLPFDNIFIATFLDLHNDNLINKTYCQHEYIFLK